MDLSRREFAAALTGVVGAAAVRTSRGIAEGRDPCNLPAPVQALSSMTGGIVPITDAERHERIAKARRLMAEQGIGAVVIEPTSSMYYFTGVRWWPSERTFAMVLPARGEIAWVCPGFEEARARELIRFGTDIRVWQEDESPFALIAGILRDRGAANERSGSRSRYGSS